MAYCENCGTAASEGAKFCRECGRPLTAEPTAAETPGADPSPSTPLSHLTPRAFEEFTADIYSRLGYECEVMPVGADEGRDVIARKADEWVIIECKHYLSGSVGRPIVQKLHSAMMTCDAPWGIAKRGAVVTSGTFSAEARAYVASTKLPIDLIDLPALLELAHRAGVPVSMTEADAAPLYVPAPTQAAAGEAIAKSIDRRLHVHPGYPTEYMEGLSVETSVRGLYLVNASYDELFFTPSGVLLDHVHGRVSQWIDANTGEPVTTRDLSRVYDAGPIYDDRGDWPSPQLSRTDASNLVVSAILMKTARVASYVGGNNQTYTMPIAMSPDSIEVTDCVLVFLPACTAKFRLGGRAHTAQFYMAGNRALPQSGFPRRGNLCSRCGLTFVPPSRYGTAGECRKCADTLCARCSRRLRTVLIRQDDYCPEHLTKAMRTEALMGNVAIVVALFTLLAILIF